MARQNTLFGVVVLLCLGYVVAYEYAENEYDYESNPGDDYYVMVPVSRVRRQLWGSKKSFPTGGHNQQAGYNGKLPGGSYSASVSQNFNGRGKSGPQTFSGSASYGNDKAQVFGGASKTPSHGGSAHVGGKINIVNTPDHKVDAWVRHDQPFPRHRRSPQHQPGTTSGGINYEHVKTGIQASASTSYTPGRPNTYSAGANVPLWVSNDKRTRVDLGGRRDWVQGNGHRDNVLLNLSHNFR